MAQKNANPRAGDAGARQELEASSCLSEIAEPTQALPKATLVALYDDAKRLLAECRSVDDAKPLRNKALALAVFAKQAKDHELINHATAIRLRAERRSGELLREMQMQKNQGTIPGKTRSQEKIGS